MTKKFNTKHRGTLTRILAHDVETTGVCFNSDSLLYKAETGERHQILSWGLMIVDGETLESIDELYLEIKWNEKSKEQKQKNSKFGTFAENIHGLTFEHLEEHGVDEEDAVVEVANLIIKHWGSLESGITCLGHNVAFDNAFLVDIFKRMGLPFKLHTRQIDSFPVGFINWGATNSDELFAQASDMPEDYERADHNALDDISLTVQAMRNTRKLFERSL